MPPAQRPHHITVHGGVDLKGKESEITNLRLDVATNDPVDMVDGNIWYNDQLDRVSYVERTSIGNTQPVVRRLANLDDLYGVTHISVSNATDGILSFGQPVYNVDGFSVSLANASQAETHEVLGLLTDNVQPNGSGSVRVSGLLTGTVEQWVLITGEPQGLIKGKRYFLDVQSGRMTSTPPTGVGQYLCPLGKALSSTELFVQLERAIAL